MFAREILGASVYHLIFCFVLYSMLGWLVESIYMSFCNKKLTNRGFTTSPFCPIYGFGGMACSLVLSRLAGNYVLLYFAGAISATLFEFMVAKLMLRLFGNVWWDYTDKPFNYKGIICLESTIAWGFYAVLIVRYLDGFIQRFVERIDYSKGAIVLRAILTVVIIDFTYHLLAALGVNIKEYQKRIADRYNSFKARWY